MKSIHLFLVICGYLFVTSLINAQDIVGEQIRSFDSHIQIQENGGIEVTETIIYDFGSDQRHGIFRTIPIDKTNTENKTYRMSFNLLDVTNEKGEKYTYSLTKDGGLVELKIGDPNITITGANTYIITYRIGGALTYFTNHDELYWNVTGNEWEIPISQATSTIVIPSEIESTKLTADCYTGIKGSQDSICTKELLPSQVVFSTSRFLNQSEGLTIAVTFPKNIVSVLEPVAVVSFWDTFMGKVVLLLLFIFAVCWYILYPLYLPLKWYFKGRDPFTNEGNVQAQFEPPKTKANRHLTPAETGTLIDEHAGPREISALLIDLARRGYIKIVENKKNDFSLEKTKEYQHDSNLRNFEKTLLNDVFKGGNKLNLKNAKLYDTVTKVQDQLYTSLVHEGFFPDDPSKVRAFYNGIIAAASITFNFFLILTASIFGRIMPHKTLEGVRAANHTRSLKNFLNSQERQLEFQAKNQLFFEKLLPFAVAFGVEKVWAKRFEDIDMKQPDWYQSSTSQGSWNADMFTRSLNSSFASFNSAATPPVSSSGFSSGSGGGGSSGGGGGGGGGGSW